MYKYMPLMLRNLHRNPKRTTLTALSMSLMTYLVSILCAVYVMLYHAPSSNEASVRLITRHSVSLIHGMPQYYAQKIAQIHSVENITPKNWFGGKYRNYRFHNYFARYAVDPTRIFAIYQEMKIPPEQLEAFQRDRRGMAIGRRAAERAGIGIGQRITIEGDIFPYFDPEFTIQAIFEGGDEMQAFFHFEYFQEGVSPNTGVSEVGTFVTLVQSSEDAGRIAGMIDEMFKNSSAPTTTESESAFLQSLISQLGNIKLFILSIVIASVFSILLVSANTIAMSTRERKAEIGILKTLGFGTERIVFLILGECMVMGTLAGMIGALLAFATTRVIGNIIPALGNFEVPLFALPFCLALAILVSILSATIPAIIAGRTTAVEALGATD